MTWLPFGPGRQGESVRAQRDDGGVDPQDANARGDLVAVDGVHDHDDARIYLLQFLGSDHRRARAGQERAVFSGIDVHCSNDRPIDCRHESNGL